MQFTFQWLLHKATMMPIATPETNPAVSEILRYWKQRSSGGLMIAGFITMLIALWSISEPGFHKTRKLIEDFAQTSIPVEYTPEPVLLRSAEIKDVTMVGCWP